MLNLLLIYLTNELSFVFSDDATETCFCYIWDAVILEYLISILIV